MPTSYDSLMASLLQSNQNIGEAKTDDIARRSAEKQRQLDPNFEVFDPDLYEVVDADTLRHRRTKENIRIQGPEGEAINSFETSLAGYTGSPEAEKRALHHRRNYAAKFGGKAEDVSLQEMIDFGQIQSERLKQNIEGLRGVGMRRQGKDSFGRTLSQFDDYTAFGDAKTIEGNASYDAPFNIRARARDIADGTRSDFIEGKTAKRSIGRALAGDATVNFASGAARMASGLMQAGSVILGVNGEGVDELFTKSRKAIDEFKEEFTSPGQKYREKVDARKAAILPELFEIRKQREIEAGKTEKQAAFSAGVDEYTDRVGYLFENPGRVLDAFYESAPYMLGVGAIGRVAVGVVAKQVSKTVLNRVTARSAAQGVAESPAALANQAAKITNRYTSSTAGRKMLSKAADNIGMTTVGLSEGLSTAADVYDRVLNMTEEEAQQSEEYNKLRKSGLDHKAATKQLAEKAFKEAFGTMTLLAAAAARGTGAGGFEAKLFTGLGRTPKALPKIKPVKAPAVTKLAKVAKVVKPVVAPVGRAIKHVSKPGAKEFVEETIQSGGGEFLSQLAQFDATGEAIGPGIGAAAAEGGIVGFFSGSTASAVTDSLRAVAHAATKPRTNVSGLTGFKNVDTLTRAAVATPTVAATPPDTGGAAQPVVETAKEAFDRLSNDIFKEDHEGFLLEDIRLMEMAHAQHVAEGGTFTTEEENILQGAVSLRKEQIASWVQEIRQKDESKWTDLERLTIEDAGRMGLIDPETLEDLPEDAQDALESIEAINTLERSAKSNLKTQIEQASSSTAAKRAVDVHNEKFGDAIGSKGPGLAWFRREMNATNLLEDETSREQKFLELSERLGNFINSQASKLAAYNTVIENKKGTNAIKYVEGSTEAIAAQMEKELDIMTGTHEALKQQFLAWNPDSTTVQSTVQAAEASPVASDAPRAAEASQSVVEEDTTAPTATEEVTSTESPEDALESQELQPETEPAQAQPADDEVTVVEEVEDTTTVVKDETGIEDTQETAEVTKEVIERAAQLASIINEKTRVPAIGIADHWQSFLENTQANWERFKGQWVWPTNKPLTESDFPAIREETEKRFTQLKLPTSLSDAFSRKSQTTNTLFAAFPDVMGLLKDPATRSKVLGGLKLKDDEKKAFMTFVRYYDAFDKTLQDNYRKLDLSKSFAGVQLQEHGIHYFEDNNDVLDPNLVGAMALEAMIWATGSAQQTVVNDDETINRILGRPSDHLISDSERNVLGYAGTIRNNAAKEIGFAIWKHLNLQKKANPDVNALFMDKLIMTLGGTALSVLQIQGRAEFVQVDRKWFEAAKELSPDNRTTLVEGEGVKINFARSQQTRNDETGLWDDNNNDLINGITEGAEIFARMFGVDAQVKMPMFDKPKTTATVISRSVAKISKLMQKRMLRSSQRSWSVEAPLMSILSKWDPQKFLELGHNYVPESRMDEQHITKREGIVGRNRGLERDFSAAMKWNEEHGSTPFYFALKMIRSGRVYINSNVINPQASKLHRFMFGMKHWGVDVPANPTTKGGEKRVEDMKIAIALGLGINSDKLLRQETLDQVQVVLESEEMTDALAVLDSDVESYTEGQMTTLSKLFDDGEGTHSMVAILAWHQYLNATEDTIKISLPMETDGITNGYIAGLLQTPPAIINETFLNMLRAGGIFMKGDPWNNFPDYVDKGGKDNYQQVGGGTASNLVLMVKGELNVAPKAPHDFRDNYLRENATKVTESGLLPSIKELTERPGRNWAKTPLMVVAYGASIVSVIRAMKFNAFEKFHENLAQAALAENPLEAIADAINSAHNIANAALDANRRAFVDKKVGPPGKQRYGVTPAMVQVLANRPQYGGNLTKFATEYTLEGDVLTLFNLGIETTYGAALGRALDDKLKPIQKIRAQLNHANKLMNIIFVRDFLRRIDTIQKTRNGVVLTPAERQNIYEEMHREGLYPSVAMATSDGLNENLETTNFQTEYVGGDNGVGETKFQTPIQIIDRAYAGLEGKLITPKKQAAIFNRVISNLPNTDVGVSGVVKLIHALDGVNNSAAWGTDTEAWDVLNVHDAQLSPFHLADDIAAATNKDFLQMHAGYSLGDAILESTSRMMALLLDETDPRLSKKDKVAIYKDFVDHLIDFNAVAEENRAVESIVTRMDEIRVAELEGREVDLGRVGSVFVIGQSDEILVENWWADLQGAVASSNASRAELFELIGWSNQFAKEGSEVPNPVSKEDLAQPIETLTAKMSPVDILRNYRDELLGRSSTNDRNLIENLKEELRNGGEFVNQILGYYLDQNDVSMDRLLSALAAAYVDQPAGRTLAVLHNILKPHLGTVAFRKRFKPNWTESGKYFIADDIIILNASLDTLPWVTTLFHESIHAANFHKMELMQTENPEIFEGLYDNALARANGMARGKEQGSKNFEIAQQVIKYSRGKDKEAPARAVTEWLAYSLTLAGPEEDLTLFSTAIKPLLGSLFDSVQNPKTGTVQLHSTGQPVDRSLFEQRYTKLESDKMQQIFEDLAQYDQGPVDAEHQATLQALLNDFIIPGIQSLETVMEQEIAKDPYGTEHLGEIEGSVIRLQAAGNKLTSNVDMSMQETALHEYTHGILKVAVDKGGDQWVRKEARRLYDLAKNDRTKDEWITSLMPSSDQLVGDPAIARERAEERYEYIFNNVKGENYHEFLAIALTNKEFAEALQEIDNRVEAISSLSGGILNQILEVLRRAVQYLSGQSLRTSRGSVHEGVFALAKATIAINQRHMQKIQDLESGQDQTSVVNRINDRVLQVINDRIIEPLRAGFAASEKKRLDPKNPTYVGFAKATAYVALRSKDEDTRKAYREVYRAVGGTKDNIVAELFREVTPWNEDLLGTEGSAGWMDLLRKSKVIIDMARQTMAQHTKSYLNKSFDKLNRLDDAHKEAITRVMLKTDLTSLMKGDTAFTVGDVQDLLNNPAQVDTLEQRLITEMRDELAKQGAGKLLNVFLNQANSLAQMMVTGKHVLDMGMMNPHNIVNQFMFDARSKVSLDKKEVFINLVDRITTLKALRKTPPGDITLALDMVNHEMAREDVGADNGFSRLLGMQMNFQIMSKELLFKDNPVQMIKGYVYEIFDGDINIEVVDDTPAERERMEQENMIEVGPVARDDLDPNRRRRIMYKGLQGLAGYNKSITSLNDMQHRGGNLFEASGFDSQTALQNLGDMRRDAFRAARKKQFQADVVQTGEHMVPVLDDHGNVTDFRYMMSEANKQKILKKKDPFDKVLPRMFASINDRNNTKEINSNVADLLWQEYNELSNSKEHRFVRIGKFAMKRDTETGRLVVDRAARDMWNLIPDPMKEQLSASFRGEFFYIRDDVVNLVLGFRKMSISKGKLWGKHAPIVKMAEKHWQEIVQLERIKIAVLTPAVVIGNIASNTAMLLSEGIPVNYIRKKAAEAISAMRTYQKDVRRADELAHEIGSDQALGRSVRVKINELTRLRADIAANPVGRLVREGLFTSIAEDVGAGDDTIHDNFIARTVEKARTKGVPGPIVTAVQEAYMLPGSRGYRAAVAATQYGDFVARYVKLTYDMNVLKLPKKDAINRSLAAFIYYDIPQHKFLQYLNDTGFIMFTKFFMRIQPIVARMYTQNPASAFTVLAIQSQLMGDPFNENIMNYGFGDGLTQKPTINPLGKAVDTLRPDEPALLQWLLNPFGL